MPAQCGRGNSPDRWTCWKTHHWKTRHRPRCCCPRRQNRQRCWPLQNRPRWWCCRIRHRWKSRRQSLPGCWRRQIRRHRWNWTRPPLPKSCVAGNWTARRTDRRWCWRRRSGRSRRRCRHPRWGRHRPASPTRHTQESHGRKGRSWQREYRPRGAVVPSSPIRRQVDATCAYLVFIKWLTCLCLVEPWVPVRRPPVHAWRSQHLKLDVRLVGFPREDAVLVLRRRLFFALHRFQGRLVRVSVRGQGGMPTTCRVRATMPPLPDVLVEVTHPSPQAAMDQAVDRMGRAVARALRGAAWAE